MLIFAVNIFLSAFLLFQIQPMIGKFILPWFGGTPAVWSTAMLFFQALLTGGYAYAYWLIKQSKQRWIHTSLLVLTLTLLIMLGLVWRSPITPPLILRPAYSEFPVFNIFLILLASVGLPYFVLASTSPLLQAWFSRLQPNASYARLYALSNVGSLLGLMAYPVLVEPNFSLQAQGWSWSIGFFLFATVSLLIVYRLSDKKIEISNVGKTETVSISLKLLWLILGSVASLFLLAITNQITQEVAAIPFLWVLPLVIYLLSFILAFSDLGWYDKRVYALLFSATSLAMLYTLMHEQGLSIVIQILIYCLLLFFSCMICHGELYQLRPTAHKLTTFYLMTSLGGAFGGVFVNFVAPVLFNGYWEFYLGWLMTVLILAIRLFPRWIEQYPRQTKAIYLSFFVSVVLIWTGLNQSAEQLMTGRNFYGVISVKELDKNAIAMIHGITVHGIQYKDKPYRPTTYYTEDSGIGLLLLNHPKRGHAMHVGLLGLGAGTLAIYGELGDSYQIYEINQIVIDLAEGQGDYFTFLNDSSADLKLIPGDARISLENQLLVEGSQKFDVLVLDTFNSDSIPFHLLTAEAFELYLKHLESNGSIAVHISNRYLDLQPVLWQLSQKFDLTIIRIDNDANSLEEFPSVWVLMSKDISTFSIPEIQSRAQTYENYSTTVPLFTDNYSNLFQILR